ncbi:MAG TPA: peptidoglycan-binding domain-containing protein [Candidatus Binatia bacterium]|nr:peptidoglycan-binding domain-containing protein [Candidatus Binatia bacterium]
MAKNKLRTIFLILAAIAISALPVCAQTRTDRAPTGSSAAQSPSGGDAAVTGQSPTGRTQTSPVTPQSSAGMAASSEEIQKLQQALKDRGQDPGTVNGVMTPQTQQALRNFQAQQGLNATGTLDAQSRTALGLGLSAGNAPATGGTGAGNSTGTGLGTPIDPTLTPGQEAVPGSTSRGTSAPAPSTGLGTRAPSLGTGTESGVPGTAGTPGAGGLGGTGSTGGTGGAGGAGGAAGGK